MNDATLETIARNLEHDGYIVLPSFVPRNLACALLQRITNTGTSAFLPAGIGRGSEKQTCEWIRGDRIKWLDESNATDNSFLTWMEQLRLALNRCLYLGLFDYESHYAVYEKGSYYKKHIDTLKGSKNRVVSTVIYLNEQWNADDGGELILYRELGEGILRTVTPEFGTMVLFLSERFPHEVLAANRTRFSIAGWFRVNGSYANRPAAT
jgi:SM-20-related protein